MVINTNIAATRGARILAESTNNLQNSLARLSSGSKIVNPQDDAAGSAVASALDAQINRTSAVQANIGNSMSFMQTQDGYMGKVQKALDRMSELSTLAQDGTKTDTDRELYNKEFQTLGTYISNVATQKFNGVTLFDGSKLATTEDSDGNKFEADGVNFGATAYTAATGSAVDTAAHAADALTNIKAAITQLGSDRAGVGADLSRLNLTNEHLSVLNENLQASVSRITDVDVAQESAKYARNNILVQSGTSMLAQANALPQSALKLLQ
jgi:flagellin